MSTVLHPSGPEPPQTYWVRRALVIGAAVVALIVLIAVIISQNSAGSVVVQGSPSPPVPSPVDTALAPTPTPTETMSSSATASPSATDSTAKAKATATASSSATATSSASAGAKATAKADADAKAKAKAKADAEAKANAEAKARAAGPGSCPADDLRATLTGQQKLKPKQDNTFKVSLINGSGLTCFVDVTAKNFELKIYSGKDRIWSSKDCSKSFKGVTKKLAKEEAAAWSMTWNGRRSAEGCKQRPEIPRAGTYVATAQFEGTKPVKLRMILKK